MERRLFENENGISVIEKHKNDWVLKRGAVLPNKYNPSYSKVYGSQHMRKISKHVFNGILQEDVNHKTPSFLASAISGNTESGHEFFKKGKKI